MEAKLRYQKELRSGSRNSTKSKLKKLDYPQNGKINKIDITHSAPKEIPKAYGAPRIDFIQRNIEQASNQKSRAKGPKVINHKEKVVNRKHAPGEIPDYYSQRALDMEKSSHCYEDGSVCPPGMRLLSEEEKAIAIDDLTEQKQEIESTLGRAPLRIESPQLQRQQRMLEQQLIDIESSLEQLKKKYVFVPE
ncbi:hypothetical protein M9Y10_028108 [Tritrichomonas musculus]|uniref:Enkurin domain-containing protein n=1 Tax=Tritrichomonas musculus TaxID=1915356 RepID=A0ABR2KIV8_9EUKA